MSNLTATYKNGALLLDQPLELKDGSRVELVVVEKDPERKNRVKKILSEIASLKSESSTETFSGRDHDEILYGRRRAR